MSERWFVYQEFHGSEGVLDHLWSFLSTVPSVYAIPNWHGRCVRAARELLRAGDGLDYTQALFGLDWLIPPITFFFSPPPLPFLKKDKKKSREKKLCYDS